MIQNKLDDIIKDFCSDYDLRLAIMKPQFEPDTKLIIATDAHILIVAPDSYFDTKFENDNKFPNWREVMPADSNMPIFKLKTHDILAEIALIPLEEVFEDCESCGGSGECENCRCGAEHDCGHCNGTGHRNKVIAHKLTDGTRFKINGIAFATRFINKVAQVAERLSCDEIAIHHFKEKKAMLCFVNDIKIMVMPLADIDSDYEHIELQTY